jgi:hypothetical protein
MFTPVNLLSVLDAGHSWINPNSSRPHHIDTIDGKLQTSSAQARNSFA